MRNLRIIRYSPATPTEQAIMGKSQERFNKSTYGNDNLPPMWGKVVEITGIDHVDIELTSGVKITHVPVRSMRWVRTDGTDVSGHKDIPPVGSKVLVIFPDGIIENALVLCSGFDSLVAAQTETLLKEGEEKHEIDIDEYGWKYDKDKTTGKIIWESPDGVNKITLTIDVEGKSIVLNQFGNEITLNNAGFNIDDKNGNKITSTSTELTMNAFGVSVKLSALGITLISGDATLWCPNVLTTCVMSGAPHGGILSGILKLKGN